MKVEKVEYIKKVRTYEPTFDFSLQEWGVCNRKTKKRKKHFIAYNFKQLTVVKFFELRAFFFSFSDRRRGKLLLNS